ncbi:MAG: RNA polymerase sigma-70 factor [Bacteroidales bacterium]|jgi:RNA polymerase sigma-70 factor (ECF subfamily)|nr:RNA polymerase sigma-70 factor [Bacteroidales bacterium]
MYVAHYAMLCTIAYEYMRNKVLAEEMVEDTFLAIWERRDFLVITISERQYLVKSVQNTCLQYLRKKKIETQSFDEDIQGRLIPWNDDYPLGGLFEKELSDIIRKAINALPPQCRKVFLLSRDEEMSYTKIAETLSISENTVKTQIKTALSRLREALKDYPRQ